MSSRLDTVKELESLYKQALTPVPPHPQAGGPAAPPQGDPAMQQGPPPGDPAMQGAPPPGAPPQGPPPGDPAMQGAPPPGGAPPPAPPGGEAVPPAIVQVIEKVVGATEDVGRRMQALETEFAQDKLLRDKDRENAEKRKQLIEQILPVATV